MQTEEQMKRLFIILILMTLSSAPALAEYAVGDTPPDFTCEDTYGNSWNLYEQRGKVVLINFGATW